jgi:nucleoid-associated protein YgaU
VVLRVLRRMTTAVSIAGAVLALRWATAGPLSAVRAGSASFDERMGLAAALGCWALLGWVALVLTAAALASIPGGVGRLASEATARLIPAAMRPALQLALGLAVFAGPAAVTSAASTTPAAAVVATTDSPSAASGGLLLPAVGRPGWSGSVSKAPVGTGSRDDEVATVVVVLGDCLWTIAANSLGPGATNAAIAAEWPRWYEANHRVIGADPDLLLPGTVLHAPAVR